ncbi:MAG: helix-hairpin-helix domain-containing protein [bacterium]|nr:helix-hairpin-helix domain-containing protein [bacterium]
MQRRSYETVVLGILITLVGAGAFVRYHYARPRFVPLMTIATTNMVHEVYLDRVSEVRININSATLDELDALPGVSRAAARRIIARRVHQPFRDLAEVAPILGISERRFAALAEIAYCGPSGTNSPGVVLQGR